MQGGALELDEAVYTSESETGHRKPAQSLICCANFGVVSGDPERAGRSLFSANCAIFGRLPRPWRPSLPPWRTAGSTRSPAKRAVSERVVRGVLSVMTTCGMYDSAGGMATVGGPAGKEAASQVA